MTPVSESEKALTDVCSYPGDFADWLEKVKLGPEAERRRWEEAVGPHLEERNREELF